MYVVVCDGCIFVVGDVVDVVVWFICFGVCVVDDMLCDKVLMLGFVEGYCYLMEGVMWDVVYVGYYDWCGFDGMLWLGLCLFDVVFDWFMEVECVIIDDGLLFVWGFDLIFFGIVWLMVCEFDCVLVVWLIVILYVSVYLMNVNGVMFVCVGIDEDIDIDGVLCDVDGCLIGEL